MRCDSDMSQNAWSSVVKPRYIKNFSWSKNQTKSFRRTLYCGSEKIFAGGILNPKKGLFDAWEYLRIQKKACVTATFLLFSFWVLRVIEKSVNDFFFSRKKRNDRLFKHVLFCKTKKNSWTNIFRVCPFFSLKKATRKGERS